MSDLMTRAVNSQEMREAVKDLIDMAVQFGIRLLVAVFILVAGLWLAKRITKSVRRVMERRELEPSLQSFLLSFISIVLKVFVVIIVLTTVGVQMTSIVAVLGAASLAIGMALSGTLQNFAGGIVILLFKPFKVGDTIEIAAGQTGVVKKIMIFTTEIHTFDNQVVYVPNGTLSNGTITNLSQGTLRRSDLLVRIAYGASVDVAREIILGIVNDSGYIVTRGVSAPEVFIAQLTDSAVVLKVRYWTKYADVLDAEHYILENIYTQLPKKKIGFPFPQMDVHVVK